MARLHFVSAAAAAIGVLVSAAAGAQDREPVTARVLYADLNVATASGEAALRRRIRSAASQACESGAVGLEGAMDRSRCMREMERDGNTRLAALSVSRTVQVASAAGTSN